MRIVGFTFLVVLALIGLFGLGLFGVAHFENPGSSFQTYEQLQASGLIERGWLPDHLPKSATQIEESHDIDTNEGSAYFKYQVGDTTRADQGCQLIQQTDNGRKYLCPPLGLQTAIVVLRNDGTGYVSMHADAI